MRDIDLATWRDRPGRLLGASLAAAVLTWWLARATSGHPGAGRYDLELLSYASSFLSVLFALLSGLLAALLASRPVVRRVRGRHEATAGTAIVEVTGPDDPDVNAPATKAPHATPASATPLRARDHLRRCLAVRGR